MREIFIFNLLDKEYLSCKNFFRCEMFIWVGYRRYCLFWIWRLKGYEIMINVKDIKKKF